MQKVLINKINMKMCNVPPKFYQVCRLCLTLVSDSDVVKLSIFDAPNRLQINNKINNNCGGGSVIINNSNRAAISTRRSGGAVGGVCGDNKNVSVVVKTESPDNNNHHHHGGGNCTEDDDDDDYDDEDDDSRLDILERIYTFLEIKVSFLLLTFLNDHSLVFFVFVGSVYFIAYFV